MLPFFEVRPVHMPNQLRAMRFVPALTALAAELSNITTSDGEKPLDLIPSVLRPVCEKLPAAI